MKGTPGVNFIFESHKVKEKIKSTRLGLNPQPFSSQTSWPVLSPLCQNHRPTFWKTHRYKFCFRHRSTASHFPTETFTTWCDTSSKTSSRRFYFRSFTLKSTSGWLTPSTPAQKSRPLNVCGTKATSTTATVMSLKVKCRFRTLGIRRRRRRWRRRRSIICSRRLKTLRSCRFESQFKGSFGQLCLCKAFAFTIMKLNFESHSLGSYSLATSHAHLPSHLKLSNRRSCEFSWCGWQSSH